MRAPSPYRLPGWMRMKLVWEKGVRDMRAVASILGILVLSVAAPASADSGRSNQVKALCSKSSASWFNDDRGQGRDDQDQGKGNGSGGGGNSHNGHDNGNGHSPGHGVGHCRGH